MCLCSRANGENSAAERLKTKALWCFEEPKRRAQCTDVRNDVVDSYVVATEPL